MNCLLELKLIDIAKASTAFVQHRFLFTVECHQVFVVFIKTKLNALPWDVRNVQSFHRF